MTIKTKYNIGDMVWILDGYQILSTCVKGVDVQVLGNSKPYVQYKFFTYPPLKEEHVFKTKEELIKYIEK